MQELLTRVKGDQYTLLLVYLVSRMQLFDYSTVLQTAAGTTHANGVLYDPLHLM